MMHEKRLNVSQDLMRTIAALSHILSWGELWTYTMLLYERDPNTLLVRVNQTEIGKATGYDTSMVKGFVGKLQAIGLIRKWRSQPGNYYQFVFPLPEVVIEAIREKIPTFGRELEMAAKRKRKSKKVAHETVYLVEEIQQLPIAADNVFPVQDTFDGDEQLCIPQEEQPMGESIIPEEVTPVTLSATPASSEPVLDQRISSLLDEIERGTVRNTVCRFLEAEGVLDPQLALDQKIVVNRERLLSALLEHDANTLDKFGERVQAFSLSPSGQQPYIDVPGDFPIYLLIHRKLDLDPCGEQWLRKAVKFKDDYGWPLSDWEVRKNLYDFMLGHGLRNFDEVIVMAKAKQCEIVDSKKSAPYVPPEQFGLGPQYMQ